MGIRVTAKTKAKASLKLYNNIVSYMFEQEFDEMKGNTKLKEALTKAKDALAKVIQSSNG